MVNTRTFIKEAKNILSCGLKHQHSDSRKVEVEIVIRGGGEAAAEGSLLTHDALPAPEPEALLHLVLDEPRHLAVHPGPPHVTRHLHGALGDGDDQQRVILSDKYLNIENSMSSITS